jgi:hypothetical protein
MSRPPRPGLIRETLGDVIGAACLAIGAGGLFVLVPLFFG